MARNILITRRDFVKDAAASFSSDIPWALALENMADPNPQLVAEASYTAWSASRFTVDLGYERTVGLFGFANLDVSLAGMIQVVAKNAASSTTYDSGVVSATPIGSTPGGFDEWGQFTLSGKMNPLYYAALRLPRLFIPTTPVRVKTITVQIMDSAAVIPARIGCFGAFETWEPPINFDYGWSLTSLDASDVASVPFGSTYVTDRGRGRRLNLGLPALDQDELWARGLDLALTMGRSAPLWVVPFPDTTTSLERTAVYGRVSTDSQISNPFFQTYQVPIQVDQAR